MSYPWSLSSLSPSLPPATSKEERTGLADRGRQADGRMNERKKGGGKEEQWVRLDGKRRRAALGVESGHLVRLFQALLLLLLLHLHLFSSSRRWLVQDAATAAAAAAAAAATAAAANDGGWLSVYTGGEDEGRGRTVVATVGG
ncbi:hypothetical protein K0M31_016477 [Melipona bicolor]|uniref:Uncharacterized protein n=1 Tax=Melipona bicolor TaxID=60889 RepID=A0AA40G7H8_9HYME|nr:hypothetical protein K0M31_016477 [Melipona bicolor]